MCAANFNGLPNGKASAASSPPRRAELPSGVTNVRAEAASRGLSRLVQPARKSGGGGGRGYISRTAFVCFRKGRRSRVSEVFFSPPTAFCQTGWLITFIHDWIHLAALWPRPAWPLLSPSAPSELIFLPSEGLNTHPRPALV